MTSVATAAVPGALMGAATGIRSTSGTVAVLTGIPPEHLPGPLQKPAVRTGALILAVGELVGDKLPKTPDRTGPAGFIPRVVLGALTAGGVARATAAPAVPVAAVGLAASVATTLASLQCRRWVSARIHPQVAAVLEDISTAGLAAAGAYLTRRAIDAQPAPITEQVPPLANPAGA